MALAQSERRTFAALDGLRGVAALAVAVFHFGEVLLPQWAPHAYVAVDLFFAISGFVLAHAYGERLRDGELSAGRFMGTRLLRLYPLHLLGLALGLAAGLAWYHLRGDRAVLALLPVLAVSGLLFAPVLSGTGAAYGLNPVTWSLVWELVANAAYGKAARRLGLPALAALVALGAGAEAVWALKLGGGDGGSTAPSVLAGGARVLFSFPLGILIHHAWRAGRLKRLPAIPPSLLLALAAVFFCAPVLASPAGPSRAAFDLAGALLLMPTLVCLAAVSRPGERAARLMSSVGAPSYALYSIHWPLALAALAAARALHAPPIPCGLAALAATGALAVVADRAFDPWARRRLETLWPARLRPPGIRLRTV